ncbi:hypothetical protein [Streptomyces sp. NPDC101178]|uniref:hypothetical protein n=1 Tax=Streptomyces sp. NPDC101178 TaxID=3366124 RepID=UPI00381E286B
MNLFLNYLAVTALFAFVALPAAIGLVRERRIDRQLRDAERREVAPTEPRSTARPYKVTRHLNGRSWVKA